MSSVARCSPEHAQSVSVRSRQWIVNEARPSTLPAPALKATFPGSHLLTLSPVEDGPQKVPEASSSSCGDVSL
jgi:hypothetical protein